MRLWHDVVDGNIQVLFISPEKLDSNSFRNFLKKRIGPQRLQFACIDEAHCISEWSHNFRPSYLRLRQILRDYLQIPCILACTATATAITQREVDELASKLSMRMKRDYGAVVEGYHAGKQDEDQFVVPGHGMPEADRDC